MAAIRLSHKIVCPIFKQKVITQARHLRRMSTRRPSPEQEVPLRKGYSGSPEVPSSSKRNDSETNESQSGLSTFSWLSEFGPKFMIRGEQVEIITDPQQFYTVLKQKTREAKKRITLASLYLGTGPLEEDLVSSIREACEVSSMDQSDFEVNILLDNQRGSRGEVSSRTMLYPLMKEHKCVNVSLYHTPDLRGFLKSVLPERFKEGVGLTHIKLYLFDDSFIISGANLSNDYFSNRQDRYILFSDVPEMADFFHSFVKSVMTFSLELSADGSTGLAQGWPVHPFEDSDDGSNFKQAARETIEASLREAGTYNKIKETDATTSAGGEGVGPPDTAVYPLVQMGPLGVRRDEDALVKLLETSRVNERILLASGYFNLTDRYTDLILGGFGQVDILMASPQANGFLGARGVAGAIPYSYIYLAQQFMQSVLVQKQHNRIQMKEYSRDQWTFHGKGVWCYLPGAKAPSMTLIGSPNYGYRSVDRDLECEVAIVTDNNNLKEQLKMEHEKLYAPSDPVTPATFDRPDRYVKYWIRLVTWAIRHYF